MLVEFASAFLHTDSLPNVCDFAEGLIHVWECAIAQHHCQFSQSCDLEERLNLIQRLAVRRIANAQSII